MSNTADNATTAAIVADPNKAIAKLIAKRVLARVAVAAAVGVVIHVIDNKFFNEI